MGYQRRVAVPFTTDGAGAATVYSEFVNGFLHSVFYDYGDAATGADFTVTEEDTGKALLTITNAGTADWTIFPRTGEFPIANTGAGTAVAGNATTGGLGVVQEMNSVNGRIKIVVAQGDSGVAKSGILYFTIAR